MSDRIEVMMKAKNCSGGHNLKRLLAPLFIAILLFSIAPTASANPWASFKEITIDYTKVDVTLENFPVLISITDTDLRDDAQDDGDDLVFTDGTNSIRLDHEIEKFDGTTGELQAWVRIPSLSSGSDTVIRMYYGNPTCGNQENPTGVWDGNYKGVWHLKEDAAGTGTADLYQDSTTNNNDGGDYVSDTGKTGKINDGQKFDGSDDYINIPNFDPPHQGTVSLWVKRGSINTRQRILGGHDAYEVLFRGNNEISNHLFAADAEVLHGSTITSITDWYYLTFTYNSTSHASAIFINGNSDATGSTANDDPGGPCTLEIGHRTGVTGDYFNGLIDEVRISDTVRSGDWISITYNNTHSPSTFYSVGGETSTGGADPVPELPTVILFAVGLLVLAGYVMLRRGE